MTATEATISPRLYLRAQTRWRPAEIVFWLATLLPYVLFPNYLSLASQIAITGLFALSLDLILGYAGIVSLGHAAFFGVGAYTAGLLSKHGWGEPLSGLVVAGAAAAIVGYATSFVICRFRHLALIMLTLGFGLVAEGTGEQRRLAHRRHGRSAGHPHLEAARLFRLRPVRLRRLQLRARRAVRGVSVRAAAHSLTVRPLAARHPRKLRPHAGHRRAEPRPYPHDLHHRRDHRRDSRRVARPERRKQFHWTHSTSNDPPKWWSSSCSADPAGSTADWSAPSSSWSPATSSPASRTAILVFLDLAFCWSAVVLFLPNGILGGLAKLTSRWSRS